MLATRDTGRGLQSGAPSTRTRCAGPRSTWRPRSCRAGATPTTLIGGPTGSWYAGLKIKIKFGLGLDLGLDSELELDSGLGLGFSHLSPGFQLLADLRTHARWALLRGHGVGDSPGC